MYARASIVLGAVPVHRSKYQVFNSHSLRSRRRRSGARCIVPHSGHPKLARKLLAQLVNMDHDIVVLHFGCGRAIRQPRPGHAQSPWTRRGPHWCQLEGELFT